MSRMYTFHETARGSLHIMNGFPCEDSSESFSAEDGRYYIAIIADGHGSKSCFRSDYGAKTAVDVTLECLRQFAEAALASEEAGDRFYRDMFSNPRFRQMTIKRLTDTILAGWHDRVLEDYGNNPPSTEEMGESAAGYEGKDSRNPAHIYGTTLMAALWLPGCLLLIHQGDGRCDVFHSDGLIEQPIPWDTRCEGTATTSLCDEDAAERFRSCVINLEDRPVMACFLGCDGVEDTYRDTYEAIGGSHVLMGGVHTFYKDLVCNLATMEQAEFEGYLKTMLPDFSVNGRFSRSGSSDDVSVAGIVDLDIIRQFTDRYRYDIKRYELEEELFWKEDELRSKTRKHGILQKRVDELRSNIQEAETEQQDSENALQQLKKEHENLVYEVGQIEASLNEYFELSPMTSGQSTVKFKMPGPIALLQLIKNEILKNKMARKKAQERLVKCDKQMKQTQERQRIQGEKIRELKIKLTEAQSAFAEYDAKYREIDAARIHIEEEIATLQEAEPLSCS